MWCIAAIFLAQMGLMVSSLCVGGRGPWSGRILPCSLADAPSTRPPSRKGPCAYTEPLVERLSLCCAAVLCAFGGRRMLCITQYSLNIGWVWLDLDGCMLGLC